MIEITPELAEICGIHAGDGYLRKRGNKTEFEVGGSLEEKEYYDNHVVPLFNHVFRLNLITKKYVKGTYGFVTGNKKIANFLNGMGFPFGKKSAIVEVPKQILESNDKRLYAMFLRGILDTDGHIGFQKKTGNYCNFKLTHNYYPIIVLSSISVDLINNLSVMLDELGIKSFIRGYQPKNLRDKYSYRLVVSGVDRLNKWMELIGSKNSVKYSRYLIWRKYGFCPTNLNLRQRKDILSRNFDINNIGPIV